MFTFNLVFEEYILTSQEFYLVKDQKFFRTRTLTKCIVSHIFIPSVIEVCTRSMIHKKHRQILHSPVSYFSLKRKDLRAVSYLIHDPTVS